MCFVLQFMCSCLIVLFVMCTTHMSYKCHEPCTDSSTANKQVRVQGARIQSFLHTASAMLAHATNVGDIVINIHKYIRQFQSSAIALCSRVGAMHYLHGVPFTADVWLAFKLTLGQVYLSTYEKYRQRSKRTHTHTYINTQIFTGSDNSEDVRIAFDRLLRFIIKHMKDG
jgi:hypothetical protein